MGWRARKGTKVTDNACTVHVVHPNTPTKRQLVHTETDGSVDGVSVGEGQRVYTAEPALRKLGC